MTTPIVIQLRRKLRAAANATKVKGKGKAHKTKGEATLKTLADKVDSQRTWVETRRAKLDFAPAQLLRNNMSKMDFIQDQAESPLEAAARLARKVRQQRRERWRRPKSRSRPSLRAAVLVVIHTASTS